MAHSGKKLKEERMSGEAGCGMRNDKGDNPCFLGAETTGKRIWPIGVGLDDLLHFLFGLRANARPPVEDP